VGESSRSETAITVSGLNPGHFYGVRVIASAANNYQTASSVIRLKTLDKDGASGEVNKATAALVRSSSLHAHNTTSAVEARGDHHGSRAHGLLLDHTPAAISTGKERSSASQHGRRPTTNQRAHPLHPAAPSSTGSIPRHGEPQIPASVSDLSIEQLTEKLDAIRRDIEDTQLQKVKEEEEYQSTKTALSQERDRLKQLLKEKEDASAELKREVASLERQNRVAQSSKTAKEKLLRQKQDERKKLQVDIERWDREAEGYRKDIERMKKQKRKIVENTDKEAMVVRQRIGQWQSSIREMEEDIRRKGAYIKEVEDKRRKLRAEVSEAEAKGQVRPAKEPDARWDTKLRDLQAVYTKTLNALQHVWNSLDSIES
jgi:myosin heavy subunit